MPSRLDILEPKPKPPEPGESGESYERSLDEYEDARRNKAPGLLLPSFFGSRDGDNLRHFEIRGPSNETLKVIDVKKRNDGPANSEFKRKVQDVAGEYFDDNTLAEASGEAAMELEEDGQNILVDEMKRMEYDSYTTRGPQVKIWTLDNGDVVGLRCSIDFDKEERLWISFLHRNQPDANTEVLRVMRTKFTSGDYRRLGRVRITPGDRIVMPS